MQSHDTMQAARLAQLEGAVLALLRDAKDDGFDGLTLTATADDDQVVIDLSYMAGGMPVSGHSL